MATNETPPPRRICKTCNWWNRNGPRLPRWRAKLFDVSRECDLFHMETSETFSCINWKARKDRGGEHE